MGNPGQDVNFVVLCVVRPGSLVGGLTGSTSLASAAMAVLVGEVWRPVACLPGTFWVPDLFWGGGRLLPVNMGAASGGDGLGVILEELERLLVGGEASVDRPPHNE
jgi:hypothetical protein